MRLEAFVGSLVLAGALVVSCKDTIARSDGGPLGTSGASGTSGTGGTSGTSGTFGSSGTSGTSGTIGTSGTSGTSGSGKRVFVSSAEFDGNLGGVTGADEKCQELADDAALGGTWRAWVSTTSSPAKTRFTQSSGPYERLDGKEVAASFAALTSGTLTSPIDMDENKAPVTGANIHAWTNTTPAGEAKGNPSSCNDWKTADSSPAAVGAVGSTGPDWTLRTGTEPACATKKRIYCFEQ